MVVRETLGLRAWRARRTLTLGITFPTETTLHCAAVLYLIRDMHVHEHVHKGWQRFSSGASMQEEPEICDSALRSSQRTSNQGSENDGLSPRAFAADAHQNRFS